MGIEGNAGGCCQVGDRDFIIGRLDRADFIALHTHAIAVSPAVSFAEGSALFPEKPSWQRSENYPALRVTTDSAHACVFYDRAIGCTIYGSRPAICHRFECDHLRAEIRSAPKHGEQAPDYRAESTDEGNGGVPAAG